MENEKIIGVGELYKANGLMSVKSFSIKREY